MALKEEKKKNTMTSKFQLVRNTNESVEDPATTITRLRKEKEDREQELSVDVQKLLQKLSDSEKRAVLQREALTSEIEALKLELVEANAKTQKVTSDAEGLQQQLASAKQEAAVLKQQLRDAEQTNNNFAVGEIERQKEELQRVSRARASANNHLQPSLLRKFASPSKVPLMASSRLKVPFIANFDTLAQLETPSEAALARLLLFHLRQAFLSAGGKFTDIVGRIPAASARLGQELEVFESTSVPRLSDVLDYYNRMLQTVHANLKTDSNQNDWRKHFTFVRIGMLNNKMTNLQLVWNLLACAEGVDIFELCYTTKPKSRQAELQQQKSATISTQFPEPEKRTFSALAKAFLPPADVSSQRNPDEDVGKFAAITTFARLGTEDVYIKIHVKDIHNVRLLSYALCSGRGTLVAESKAGAELLQVWEALSGVDLKELVPNNEREVSRNDDDDDDSCSSRLEPLLRNIRTEVSVPYRPMFVQNPRRIISTHFTTVDFGDFVGDRCNPRDVAPDSKGQQLLADLEKRKYLQFAKRLVEGDTGERIPSLDTFYANEIVARRKVADGGASIRRLEDQHHRGIESYAAAHLAAVELFERLSLVPSDCGGSASLVDSLTQTKIPLVRAVKNTRP